MPNQFYTENFRGQEHQLARATDIEAEFQRIESGFDMVGGATSSITTTGNGAAYVGTLGTLTAYETGFAINVTWHEPNTGPATLNIDEVGAVQIRTALNHPVEANDLRGFQRVIYDGTYFRVISPVDSDMTRFAEDATRDITQGTPGLPGTNFTVSMNQIVAIAPSDRGEYRFLMQGSSTLGTVTDGGLRASELLEVHREDSGGTSHADFYNGIEAGDIVVLWFSASLWYAWRVTADAMVNGSIHKFPVEFMSTNASGDVNIAQSPNPVELRFSRSQTPTVGSEGVTGDDVVVETVITVHETPDNYATDPLSWPVHGEGIFFHNGGGATKTLVVTIAESGAVLTATQHDGYLFTWLRNGQAFVPSVTGQVRSRRWMTIGADDLNDRTDQFSCRVCKA